MFPVDGLILVTALLVVFAIASSTFATRVGLPVLVLFLTVGMLAGPTATEAEIAAAERVVPPHGQTLSQTPAPQGQQRTRARHRKAKDGLIREGGRRATAPVAAQRPERAVSPRPLQGGGRKAVRKSDPRDQGQGRTANKAEETSENDTGHARRTGCRHPVVGRRAQLSPRPSGPTAASKRIL